MGFNKSTLPKTGLGLGLRRDLLDETLEFCAQGSNLIEWLEIVPENYILRGAILERRFQKILASKVPLIPHSVNLSIASASWRDDKALIELKGLFTEIHAPWFSDHLSCTYIDGHYMQDLIPVPFTEEALSIITDRIKFLEDYFQLPFLLENPSYYSKLIDPEMTELDFINKLISKADCGLLLDVNNVYVNSVNHNYNPEDFIAGLDLDRVVQVHIAGHLEGYESSLTGHSIQILDTHGERIKTEVYDLLRFLLHRTEVNAILLERDSNFPEFSELITELTEIRQIMDHSLPIHELQTVSKINLSTRQDAVNENKPKTSSPNLESLQLSIKNYLLGRDSTLLSDTAIQELSIYKSLIVSAIEDLLSNVYPLSKKLILRDESKTWDELVLDYIENYPSPYTVFNRAAEFLPEYLASHNYPQYLVDLARYEWAELAIVIDKSPNAAFKTPFRVIQSRYPLSRIIDLLHQDAELDLNCTEDSDNGAEQILLYLDPIELKSKSFSLSPMSALALAGLIEGWEDSEILESLTELLPSKEAQTQLETEFHALKTRLAGLLLERA